MTLSEYLYVAVGTHSGKAWAVMYGMGNGISCELPFRYGFKIPRYQQIINHLTWMSHSQNLKRVSREHVIDLYLQPPVSKFKLMDFHHLERLVRDANRCRQISQLYNVAVAIRHTQPGSSAISGLRCNGGCAMLAVGEKAVLQIQLSVVTGFGVA